jgi:hypothetical protein
VNVTPRAGAGSCRPSWHCTRRGPELDLNNPWFRDVGQNYMKGRLRSHPDVAQRYYADLVETGVPVSPSSSYSHRARQSEWLWALILTCKTCDARAHQAQRHCRQCPGSHPSAFGLFDTDNELAGFDVDVARALRHSVSIALP